MIETRLLMDVNTMKERKVIFGKLLVSFNVCYLYIHYSMMFLTISIRRFNKV